MSISWSLLLYLSRFEAATCAESCPTLVGLHDAQGVVRLDVLGIDEVTLLIRCLHEIHLGLTKEVLLSFLHFVNELLLFLFAAILHSF